MMKDVVKVLETDPVVYLVHLNILMKEVLVLAAFQDLKAARLSALDFICHQTTFHSSLQNKFRGSLQRRGFHRPRRRISGRLLGIVVRRQLPYRRLRRGLSLILLVLLLG